MSNSRVDKFIADIQFQSLEKYQLVLKIREIILQANSSLKEDIKYGGLVFFHSSELLGGIFVYKQHLSIEMGRGVDLPDPDKLLEGSGKSRRHIKIRKNQDILTKNVEFFVKKAFAAKC